MRSGTCLRPLIIMTITSNPAARFVRGGAAGGGGALTSVYVCPRVFVRPLLCLGSSQSVRKCVGSTVRLLRASWTATGAVVYRDLCKTHLPTDHALSPALHSRVAAF